jgi:hypothetical protein
VPSLRIAASQALPTGPPGPGMWAMLRPRQVTCAYVREVESRFVVPARQRGNCGTSGKDPAEQGFTGVRTSWELKGRTMPMSVVGTKFATG